MDSSKLNILNKENLKHGIKDFKQLKTGFKEMLYLGWPKKPGSAIFLAW